MNKFKFFFNLHLQVGYNSAALHNFELMHHNQHSWLYFLTIISSTLAETLVDWCHIISILAYLIPFSTVSTSDSTENTHLEFQITLLHSNTNTEAYKLPLFSPVSLHIKERNIACPQLKVILILQNNQFLKPQPSIIE